MRACVIFRASSSPVNALELRFVVFGVTIPELGLALALVALVVLAPFAPRIGERIGALFDRDR